MGDLRPPVGRSAAFLIASSSRSRASRSRSGVPGRLAGSELLEHRPDRKHRQQLRVVDGAHSGAAERLGLDEAQELEVAERLADGRLARAELARQPRLDEALSRLKVAAEDPFEENVLDLLTKNRPRNGHRAAAIIDARSLHVNRRVRESGPVSDTRFADGLRYRIEIPSVEGPEVLRAVLEEAEARAVPVRRVSQGSGVMMLTDAEIAEMAALGAEHGVEVSLFLGPRGAWDPGGQSFATGAVGGVARGQAGVDWSLAEVRRAVALGIRSVLVADAGVLATLGRLKREGELPETLVLKTSVLLPCANPPTARALEALGASTINVSTDLSPAELGELRAACSAPLDVYVEVPDDQGGFVRFYEVPEMIRAAAPMYVKLGVRNSPNIYPAGLHLQDVAIKLGRERVRRAELVLRLLQERAPELVEGRGDDRPPDLGIPAP